MINKLKSVEWYILVAALIFSGCAGGTGEGNPEIGSLSISLRAIGSPALAKNSDAPASFSVAPSMAITDTLMLVDKQFSVFTITNVFVNVEEVEVRIPEYGFCQNSDSIQCTDSTITIAGPFFADLLEILSPAIVNDIPLPKGVFNQMKILFSKLEADEIENIPITYEPLVGHAIVMKGFFSYNGISNRPLTIQLDFDETFVFENNIGLEVASDSSYNWAGLFFAPAWFSNLEVAKCLDSNQLVLEDDGGLIINSQSSCNNIDEVIIENVKQATSLWEHLEEDDEDDFN